MIFQDKDRIVFADDSVTDMNKTHPLGEGGGMGDCLCDGYVHMMYYRGKVYPTIFVRE